MQCSAWRPVSSASTSVRPASIRTRWNSRGPSSSRTPVQIDVYGFIRSAVEERGSSWSMISRSRQAGSTFSIPISVIRTFGSVVHMRPLPSDSTTPTDPVSAIAKFAPETATGTVRNFSRRCVRAASAIAAGSSPSSWPAAIVRSNRAAISARLRWIAGTRMCDCSSSPSWTISSARSVSIAWIPRRASASLSPISSDSSDLTLMTSSRPVVARDPGDDRVRLGAVARPVDGAARAGDALLQPLELLRERRHRVRLERGAGVAQLPSSRRARRRRSRA